jgi:hypothetical protein
MMKAFRIGWAENHGTLVDLGYRFHLPWVECAICQKEMKFLKSWGNGNFEYPSFKFKFLNKSDFNNDRRALNVHDFQALRRQIQEAAGWPVVVVPGASIGELEGNTGTKKLDDFVWGRLSVPQISKRARDVLAADGINLLTAEASIRFRGRVIDSHVAVQATIAALMTEESLRRFTISHCSDCDNYAQKNPLIQPPGDVPNRAHAVVPEGYLLKRSAWPLGQHLVQSQETLKVFASEQLIESVKRHNLSGISFIESGSYV